MQTLTEKIAEIQAYAHIARLARWIGAIVDNGALARGDDDHLPFSRRTYWYWRSHAFPRVTEDGQQLPEIRLSAAEAARLARAERFAYDYDASAVWEEDDAWTDAECDCRCPDRAHGKGRWKATHGAWHDYSGPAMCLTLYQPGNPEDDGASDPFGTPIDSLCGIFASEYDDPYWRRFREADMIAENIGKIVEMLGLMGEPEPAEVY